MISEHKNILKLIDVLERACCSIIEGKEVNDSDFRKMIDFARNYADKHHHGKEEQIMFLEMTNHLGKIGSNLIQHGMLVEHDFGRLQIMDLEENLNLYMENPKTIYKLGILAGAEGYAKLLKRHIDKEDQLVYKYGENNLPKDILDSIDARVKKFEENAEEDNVQNKYLNLLNELSEKY